MKSPLCWTPIIEWPPELIGDERLWVRDSAGNIEPATRDSTFTRGWLWFTKAPEEILPPPSIPA